MKFNTRNFLNLLWNNGIKEAVKVEVVLKNDFEFDDIGLEMIDKVIDKYLAPKKVDVEVK